MLYPLSYNETELLEEVAKGNEKAFRVLFEKYHQLLGAHIFRIVKSPELTEELVMDVFHKLWMSREVLAEVRNIKAYLFIISRNIALKSLKRIARSKNVFVSADWASLETTVPLEIEDTNYYGLIEEAIDALPPQQQKVYLLSRHHRMKYLEISEQLNISRETVKKYLQLATDSITKHILNKISTTITVAFFFLFQK